MAHAGCDAVEGAVLFSTLEDSPFLRNQARAQSALRARAAVGPPGRCALRRARRTR
jgi:hypothetical protein